MAKPRVTFLATNAELDAWSRRAVQEFGRHGEVSRVARRLIEEWYAGGARTRTIPFDADGARVYADSETLRRVERTLVRGPAPATAVLLALLDLIEYMEEHPRIGETTTDPLVASLNRIHNEAEEVANNIVREVGGAPPKAPTLIEDKGKVGRDRKGGRTRAS